jgi:uncharacterized protein (DUF302 family)
MRRGIKLFSDFAQEHSMSTDGLVTLKSNHAVQDTIDRLDAGLAGKGISVFARIDHAAGAARIDMPLRPTFLLIFGSAKGGTPLMQAVQRIGIDLPLKMLCWQDDAGDVWLSYNDMRWLAARHQLSAAETPAIDSLARLLAALAEVAVA